MNIDIKREKEKELVTAMIDLYYRHHPSLMHRELLDYALNKIEHCPLMESKTFCSQCKIHCYEASKRDLIKQVMRYSGPRMLFIHPVLVLKHIYYQKIGGYHD